MILRKCQNCEIVLKDRYKIKFCSNKCQHDHQHKVFVDKWKKGIVTGAIGVTTKVMSDHIRRFLIEKHNERCSLCGWNEKHKITNKVPLEIDHIDGNAENNVESNLRLLCPNCHSLTPYFRNLNRGKGRKWRMDKLNKDSLYSSKHISF